MTLSELKSGQKGKVFMVGGSGTVQRRLLNLGVRPGEVLEMIKAAPFKDPLEIAIGNSHISIRRNEAGMITVEPLQEETFEN